MNLERCLDELCGGARKSSVDPATIPCIETSDRMRLCKNPLVSILIVTYNHELYIRECLESVVGQESEFEYEVVVGEDCSQDNTREICFEFQRRYPEKLRVLWSDENLYKISGNQLRTLHRCRGQYIAYLEGDDFWIDQHKLQKQIDAMRENDAIGCFANYRRMSANGVLQSNGFKPYKKASAISRDDIFRGYPHTATYVFRRDFVELCANHFPKIRQWYDVVRIHCVLSIGKIVTIPDAVSIYRQTGYGIATSLSVQTKSLLSIRQYLDLYLHGPQDARLRFGAYIVTYIAVFFNCHEKAWSREIAKKYSNVLVPLCWYIFVHQFWHPRTIRAILRYMKSKYLLWCS